MNSRVFLFAVLTFAGGILAAKLLPEAQPHGSGEQKQDIATPATRKAAEVRSADFETGLRTVLKDKWSMRVEDGKLHLSTDFPPGTKVEGCEWFEYGFEVYSVGAVSSDNDKVYHARWYAEGSGSRDREIGSKEEAAYDLKWLKKVLAVPEEKVQRALVVRFWAGDGNSNMRYLINERLWDKSW